MLIQGYRLSLFFLFFFFFCFVFVFVFLFFFCCCFLGGFFLSFFLSFVHNRQSIVYNLSIVYMQQNVLKDVVYVTITDQ